IPGQARSAIGVFAGLTPMAGDHLEERRPGQGAMGLKQRMVGGDVELRRFARWCCPGADSRRIRGLVVHWMLLGCGGDSYPMHTRKEGSWAIPVECEGSRGFPGMIRLELRPFRDMLYIRWYFIYTQGPYAGQAMHPVSAVMTRIPTTPHRPRQVAGSCGSFATAFCH